MAVTPPPEARLFADLLNAALEVDPASVGALVMKRVPCNAVLGSLTTVHTSQDPRTLAHSLSVLGLLNGMLGSIPSGPLKGKGWLVAVTDGPRVLRFAVNNPGTSEA